jgi:hypothetical protein
LFPNGLHLQQGTQLLLGKVVLAVVGLRRKDGQRVK